uniref:Uncharacterized protein n=1 Tax=Daucus carota subsp. sativus TaxID=79200 RepID=A0A162AIZ4_DAUCS
MAVEEDEDDVAVVDPPPRKLWVARSRRTYSKTDLDIVRLETLDYISNRLISLDSHKLDG